MALLLSTLTAVVLLSFGNRSLSVDSQTDAEGLTVAEKYLENTQVLARKDFRLVNSTTSQETLGAITYTKNVSVTSLPDFFTKNISTVVSWPGSGGRTQSITLSSLVTNFENAVGGDTCFSTLTGNWAAPQATSKLLGTDLLSDAAGLYPITGVDAYQKKLYVSVAGANTSMAPVSPTASVNRTGVGTVAWSGAAGALASGGTTADASIISGGASNYLAVTGFGNNLTIPTGATIVGIEVHVYRSASNGNAISDNQVKLIKPDGTLSAIDKADTTTKWGNSTANIQYGSAADLWGEALTGIDVKSPNFGVAISVKNTAAQTRTASIDYVTVTITYAKQLYVFDTTAPAAPTLITYIGSNTVSSGINAVVTDGTNAFAAMNSAAVQLEVINTATAPATVRTAYTIPAATAVAQALFYKNNYLYLGLANNTGGAEFAVLDVHTPSAIPAPVGTYEVGAGIKSIFVKGSYAYIATDDNSRELLILNISNPFAPTLAGIYNASGSNGFGYGRSLFSVGDTLYLGRTYDGTANANEFLILDASNPAANLPAALGSRNVGPSAASPFGIYGVIVRDYLSFILTSSPTSGGQLFAINTTNPTNASAAAPVFTVTLPNTGAGVAMDCEGNYVYAASVPAAGAFLNKGSITVVTAP